MDKIFELFERFLMLFSLCYWTMRSLQLFFSISNCQTFCFHFSFLLEKGNLARVNLQRVSQVRFSPGRSLQPDLCPRDPHPLTHEPPEQKAAHLWRLTGADAVLTSVTLRKFCSRGSKTNSPSQIWHPWCRRTVRSGLSPPAERSERQTATQSCSVTRTCSGKPSGRSPSLPSVTWVTPSCARASTIQLYMNSN